jgi:hypothetical protein
MNGPMRLAPMRLINEPADESPGGALARDLLAAGRGEALTANEKRAIWTGLAAHALVSAAPAAATVAPTAVAGGKALGLGALAKGTLVVVALAGGVVGGARVFRRAAPAVEGPAVSAPTMSAPVAPAPLPAVVLAPPPRSPALPTRESPPVPRSSPASRLAEEGRVVLDARRALREGDAASALRRLEAARAAFSGGALVQEREALAIEALGQLGRREAAAARAQAFLRAYPGSPHAAAVAKLAAP